MLLEEAEGRQFTEVYRKYFSSDFCNSSPENADRNVEQYWARFEGTRTQSGTAVAGGHLCYIPAKNMTVFCLCPENPYRAEF